MYHHSMTQERLATLACKGLNISVQFLLFDNLIKSELYSFGLKIVARITYLPTRSRDVGSGVVGGSIAPSNFW